MTSTSDLVSFYTEEFPTEFIGTLDFVYISNNLFYFCFTDTEDYRKYKIVFPLEYEFAMPNFSNNIYRVEIDYVTNSRHLGIYKMELVEPYFLLEKNQFLIPEVNYCCIETINCPHCNKENIEVFFLMSEQIYINDISNNTVVLEEDFIFKNLSYISQEIDYCINQYVELYKDDGCKKKLINGLYMNLCPDCKRVISDNYALKHSTSSAIDGGINGLKNGILIGDLR